MARYKLLVLTNALPGREKEFNEWYDQVHVPDNLRMPEVKSATRFKLVGDNPWGYFTIWDLECDDPQAWVAKATALMGTPAMRLSDALCKTTVLSMIAQPMVPE